jgi:hypothetical protein
MTSPLGEPVAGPALVAGQHLYVALALAGFTMVFGARHLDSTERHEGMVAAIAFESVVKLVAFMAVGLFVSYGLFNGVGDICSACPGGARIWPTCCSWARASLCLRPVVGADAAGHVVGDFAAAPVPGDGGGERGRAPPAAGGVGVPAVPAAHQPVRVADCHGRPAALRPRARINPETFVLSLPLVQGQHALALLAFVGGLSAATGMVIVEAIAVSTMVCNDLVMPLLLRTRRWMHAQGRRPDRAAAQHPPAGHPGHPAAGLPVLPPGGRGLCAGQHRAHQFCGGGAVCAGPAGRHVLEGRHPPGRHDRAGAGLCVLGLHADAAFAGQVGLAVARVSGAGAVGASGCSSPSSFWVCRGWTT